MRRINLAIFRCAIARLRDTHPRPGTNAMLKRRRQNGAAEKPALAACPADVTRRTRYKGQSWRTGTIEMPKDASKEDLEKAALNVLLMSGLQNRRCAVDACRQNSLLRILAPA